MATGCTKYKIWLNRSDTHGRITDENIWVGNTPGDGHSKQSSGLTMGANYAYVEFTWEELLKAIGIDSTTVDVTLTGILEQLESTGDTGYTETVILTGTLEQEQGAPATPTEVTLIGSLTQEEGEGGGGGYGPDDPDEPIEEDETFVEYNLEAGPMRVYSNGVAHVDGYEETVLFEDMEYTPTTVLRMPARSMTYTFDNVEEVGGEELYYAEIQNTDFEEQGNYKVYVDPQDGGSMSDPSTIIVYDGGINITFNFDEITIDRSDITTFRNQLPCGTTLLDYVTIDDGQGNTILDYDIRKVHFYIGRYSAGSSVYEGDAVRIINAGSGWFNWDFDGSKWTKNASDTIYVAYGTKVYDSMDFTVVESNSNKVYIRGVETTAYRCIAGKDYTIDKFIKFFPEDANFEYLTLSEFSLRSSSSSVLKVTDLGTTPTNWEEFYNSYKKISAQTSGRVHLYYTWKSTPAGGGGGDLYITVTS